MLPPLHWLLPLVIVTSYVGWLLCTHCDNRQHRHIYRNTTNRHDDGRYVCLLRFGVVYVSSLLVIDRALLVRVSLLLLLFFYCCCFFGCRRRLCCSNYGPQCCAFVLLPDFFCVYHFGVAKLCFFISLIRPLLLFTRR